MWRVKAFTVRSDVLDHRWARAHLLGRLAGLNETGRVRLLRSPGRNGECNQPWFCCCTREIATPSGIPDRSDKSYHQGTAHLSRATDGSSRQPQNLSPRHRSRAFHRTRERWDDPPSIAQCALPHISKYADMAFGSRANASRSSRQSQVCNIPDVSSKRYFCRPNDSKFDRNIGRTIAG